MENNKTNNKTVSEQKNKKTTKKGTTKKVTKKEEVVNEVVEQKTGRISRNRFRKNAIDIDPKKKVPVVSLVSYPVGYQCKQTPVFLKWNNYGEEHTMTIEEIGMMMSEMPYLIQDPVLMIDDEEFGEAYNLMEKYELIFELEDLPKFYSQRINVIENKLNRLSKETRKNLILRTIKLVNDGEINNLSVLRMLKKNFNVDIEI